MTLVEASVKAGTKRLTHIRATDSRRRGESLSETQQGAQPKVRGGDSGGSCCHRQESTLIIKLEDVLNTDYAHTMVAALAVRIPPFTKCLAGIANGLDDMRPASFKNATIEPVNVIPP